MVVWEIGAWSLTYDAVIGRWTTTDPKGEHWSPYMANGNNPVSITDPDGGCESCPENAAEGATHTAQNGATFKYSQGE